MRQWTGLLLMASLLLAACSNGDDSDGGEGGDDGDDSSTGEEDGPVTTAPADDGTAPEGPDPSAEEARVPGLDDTVELVVNEVRQEDDVVTVWATITNDGDDVYVVGPSMTDPTLDPVTQAQREDVAGVYLIDWNTGQAYYPMSTEEGTCVCSRGPLEIPPGESLSIFAVYNGIEELEGGTLVVPDFMPADGLSAS